MSVAVVEEGRDRVAERIRCTDRVARREADSRDTAVRERGAAVGREHVALVGALRERIERVTVATVGETTDRDARVGPVVARARR